MRGGGSPIKNLPVDMCSHWRTLRITLPLQSKRGLAKPTGLLLAQFWCTLQLCSPGSCAFGFLQSPAGVWVGSFQTQFYSQGSPSGCSGLTAFVDRAQSISSHSVPILSLGVVKLPQDRLPKAPGETDSVNFKSQPEINQNASMALRCNRSTTRCIY